MLKHLAISNYILIEQLNVDFSDGLNIITGETGAGKSILLGALGLILGNRSDSQALFDTSKKCIIEGTFLLDGIEIKEFFLKNELDYESSTIIRREINPEGKSRAFINDTPVSLHILKDMTEKLIDIHSQHQTLQLNNRLFQLEIADNYCRNDKLLSEYFFNWKIFIHLKHQLKELEEKEQRSKQDLDYWQFQFNELESCGIREGEVAEAEELLMSLNHAEEIKTLLVNNIGILDDEQQSILGLMSLLRKNFQQLAKFGTAYDSLCMRVESIYNELKDIHSETNKLESQISWDPEKASLLTERVDLINHLLNKHRVKSETELLQLIAVLQEKISAVSSLESEIARLNEELIEKEKFLISIAEKLSEKRIQSSHRFNKELEKNLQDLSIPEAKVEVRFEKLKELTPTGFDQIDILFSANKGTPLREIAKAASGGELSRIMLSLKSLISERKLLPTIIFDEIDTGVSGAVAEKMGIILQKMSKNMQVISITHLPQIACKAEKHFRVYKQSKNKKTITSISELNKTDRIQEIASMLSGDVVSEAAVKNAKALLGW